MPEPTSCVSPKRERTSSLVMVGVSSFKLLGKIENTVSSSEEPKENFQANDDIVGAAVYQYGDNIVVEFEGKYWLYEHYHNTDFDGNSD